MAGLDASYAQSPPSASGQLRVCVTERFPFSRCALRSPTQWDPSFLVDLFKEVLNNLDDPSIKSSIRPDWQCVGKSTPDLVDDIVIAVIALCEQQLQFCLSHLDVKVTFWSPKEGQRRFVAGVSLPSKVAAGIFGRKSRLPVGLSIDYKRGKHTVQKIWMKRRGLLKASEAPLPVVTPPPPPPPRPTKGRPLATAESFKTPSKSLPTPTKKSIAMEEVEDVLLDGSPAKSIVKIQKERGKKVFYCTFESTGARVYRCDKVSRDLLESYEKKQLERSNLSNLRREAGQLGPCGLLQRYR